MLLGPWGGRAAAGSVATVSGKPSVKIANFAYKPGRLVVPVGTRVTFSNSDGVAHTATHAGGFDTGRIEPGHSAAVKFSHPGVFAYHCTIHPSMHGTIIAQQ